MVMLFQDFHKIADLSMMISKGRWHKETTVKLLHAVKWSKGHCDLRV